MSLEKDSGGDEKQGIGHVNRGGKWTAQSGRKMKVVLHPPGRRRPTDREDEGRRWCKHSRGDGMWMEFFFFSWNGLGCR
jgi:hypothetical protein